MAQLKRYPQIKTIAGTGGHKTFSNCDITHELRMLITPNELSQWKKPRPLRCLFDLMMVWAQIIFAFVLVYFVPHNVVYAFAFLLISGGQHGLNLIAHEFAHKLVLPNSKKTNDLIGEWLFAGPGGLALDFYRVNHLMHHRLVSTKEDTKYVYKVNIRGFRFFVFVFKSLSGLDYLNEVIRQVDRIIHNYYQGSRGQNTFRSFISFGLTQLVIGSALCLWNPWVYVTLWLIPLFTATRFFNTIRGLVEHHPLESEAGSDPDGPYFKGTQQPFNRTAIPTIFERLFLCKLNFNYHLEHHLWPGISYQYLPEVHHRLRDHLGWLHPQCYSAIILDIVKGR
jgi:fatty acid desaturase